MPPIADQSTESSTYPAPTTLGRGPSPTPTRRHGMRPFDVALLCLLMLVLGLGAPFAVQIAPTLAQLDTIEQWEMAGRAAADALSASVAEDPSVTAFQGAFSRLPLCSGTEQDDATLLTKAFALMRGTSEGDRLYRQLVTEGVCVRVGDITYNSAFAYAATTGNGDWSRSFIQIAPRHLGRYQIDVLASILIHEATHIDRAINDLSCATTDTCTVLANDVELEEEVAAHAAEAEWWIAAYGEDGKRFAFGYDHGENQLIKAYLDGPTAFTAYVRDLRDDPRDGADS